ncbi:MAG: tetratricopeptide repeat protein [Candidatus Limnocylindrales bacterium]
MPEERMSFDPLTPSEPVAVSSAITASRQKRQLVDQAIDAARRADWTAAAEINQRILEMGPDSAAENRAAKACWEQGELGLAREHYQSALAIDPTNRIAERNIGRLRMLMVDAGSKTVPATPGSKAPVSIFVEETGKTGFAHLVDLAGPMDLAQVNPGDFVQLHPSGPRVLATSNGVRVGVVEPRVAARLLRLMADGNKYAAAVTSLGDEDVRIIIRETYQDPSNYGKVSFPTAARVSDLRPYTKGTLVREEADLEDELEFDEEPDSFDDIGAILPAETHAEEGFQIEGEGEPDDDEDDDDLAGAGADVEDDEDFDES